MHGQCEELLLPYLSEAGVAAYLAQRFDESSSRPRRCGTPAYQRHPSVSRDQAEEMLRQGRLCGPATGGEHVVHNAAAVIVDIPESLRRLIDQQLEQSILRKSQLEAASVAGREFSGAAVAAGTDDRVEEMEARYAALARRGQFVQACG